MSDMVLTAELKAELIKLVNRAVSDFMHNHPEITDDDISAMTMEVLSYMAGFHQGLFRLFQKNPISLGLIKEAVAANEAFGKATALTTFRALVKTESTVEKELLDESGVKEQYELISQIAILPQNKVLN